MNRKKDSTEPKTYELSEEEVTRITNHFLSPGGTDAEVADFLLLLRAIVYPSLEHRREDVLSYAEQAALSLCPTPENALRGLVNDRYKTLTKTTRR